jgi:hypothetical protein
MLRRKSQKNRSNRHLIEKIVALRTPEENSENRSAVLVAPFGCLRDAVLEFSSAAATSDCRSVELRALCNEVPRTPEGSNGTGIASGAPDHPKFLASNTIVIGEE